MRILSSNLCETLQMLVIPSPNTHSLRSPMVKLHNTFIDWSTGSIVSWSVHRHSHWLQSVLAPGELTTHLSSEQPDLSSVPPKYHDFCKVFSKQRALSLPTHRPYDYSRTLNFNPVTFSPSVSLLLSMTPPSDGKTILQPSCVVGSAHYLTSWSSHLPFIEYPHNLPTCSATGSVWKAAWATLTRSSA